MYDNGMKTDDVPPLNKKNPSSLEEKQNYTFIIYFKSYVTSQRLSVLALSHWLLDSRSGHWLPDSGSGHWLPNSGSKFSSNVSESEPGSSSSSKVK